MHGWWYYVYPIITHATGDCKSCTKLNSSKEKQISGNKKGWFTLTHSQIQVHRKLFCHIVEYYGNCWKRWIPVNIYISIAIHKTIVDFFVICFEPITICQFYLFQNRMNFFTQPKLDNIIWSCNILIWVFTSLDRGDLWPMSKETNDVDPGFIGCARHVLPQIDHVSTLSIYHTKLLISLTGYSDRVTRPSKNKKNPKNKQL